MLKKLTSLFVILIVFFSTFMVYAQTNTSSKFISKRKFTNTCKTPENILACELKLNECPSQCRPSSCKIPENILACDLKLNECPSECRFGRKINYDPNHSQEMNEAFRFAFTNKLNSSNSISQENMYGTISKTEMKRILTLFQRNVMNKKIIYRSIPAGDDLISRADFGTYLSRILWGNKNDGGDPYYQKHLQELKNLGILSNIEPFKLEVKGYVYLMLKKVAEEKLWIENNTCKTPENILACELKLNECPSQCRPSSCKIPENILACDLKLNECPSECRFGRTNKVVIDICKTPENVLACDLKLNKCPSQCRPSSCKTPESILACSLKLNECSSECRFNW